MKSQNGFQLTYLDLGLAHYKHESQGHAHFDCENISKLVTYRTNITTDIATTV